MTTSPLAAGVLADDLTGALASAGLLAEAGLRPVVQWLRHPPARGATALVADMRTRDDSTDPRLRAASWAAYLASLGCRRIELRMDSTLRGAPAAELAGVLSVPGWAGSRVLAVPAFPGAGRTVVGGRLHVRGAAHRAGGRQIAPLLFGDQAPVAMLGITLIEQGPAAVAAAARAAAARRLVADSLTEAHLRTVAAAAALLAGDGALLTVSPGAWLRYLPPLAPPPYVLVVLSSRTSANQAQLAALRRCHPVTVAHAGVLLAGLAPVDWQAVAERRQVIVVETISRPAAGDADAWLLAGLAARAAGYVLDQGARHGLGCAGIIAGGGQTASALMDVLGVTRMLGGGELAPLCPHGTVADGDWAGLRVVTKGGLVGGPGTLASLVTALREETA
jgi:uncharacterized protein YgbK (DUF1537 family)